MHSLKNPIQNLMTLFNRIWYKKHWLMWFLVPLSLIYRLVIGLRRYLYSWGIFRSHRLPVPVIIVGNITVGGTGKTPVLIALVELLQEKGFHPGVISRGYGGRATAWPQVVKIDSDPRHVGDEPVLIVRNTRVPVVVGPKRVDSTKLLLSLHPACDVIVSDDGLQHYAIQRDVEIAVIDGSRRFGNDLCLPAGPLREPVNRLKTVDLVVCNGKARTGEYAVRFMVQSICRVIDSKQTIELSELKNKKLIAVAGIGNPDRFFQTLSEMGLKFKTRIFPDHHDFKLQDIECASDELVIMTEKDAVKCAAFADERHWFVKGKMIIDAKFKKKFADKYNISRHRR